MKIYLAKFNKWLLSIKLSALYGLIYFYQSKGYKYEHTTNKLKILKNKLKYGEYKRANLAISEYENFYVDPRDMQVLDAMNDKAAYVSIKQFPNGKISKIGFVMKSKK